MHAEETMKKALEKGEKAREIADQCAPQWNVSVRLGEISIEKAEVTALEAGKCRFFVVRPPMRTAPYCCPSGPPLMGPIKKPILKSKNP
jgi:hypothetical protein